MSNKGPRVLVTSVGGSGVGRQVVTALRAAPSVDYSIVGADLNGFSPNLGRVDVAVVVPRADAEDYLPALSHVIKTASVEVLIPGSEAELKIISKHRHVLEALGVLVLINPQQTIDTCLDKRRTADFLSSIGFSQPRYFEVDELASVDPSVLPLVLKPAIGASGSRDTFVVQNREQLHAVLAHFGKTGQNLLAQEYVGTPDKEFTVGVLHDMCGEYLNSVALRRDLSGPLSQRSVTSNLTSNRSLGPNLVISSGISQGKLARFPEVTEPCRALAQALGVRGAVNIQCRLVGGEIKVFEINPRFSGTTSIRALLGYNEPDVLIRKHLLGQEIEIDFGYSEGVVERALVEELVPSTSAKDWTELLG